MDCNKMLLIHRPEKKKKKKERKSSAIDQPLRWEYKMNPDKSHKALVRYFAKSTKDNGVTFFKL